MDISFRPKSGRFGLVPVVTAFNLPANPATANSTQTHRIPSPPGRCYPVKACIQCATVGADADGTLTATLIRRRASDDADVSLTSALDMETMTASEKSLFAFLSSLTDAQRIFLAADTCELDIISNSAAIDTQPATVIVTVEWAVLE